MQKLIVVLIILIFIACAHDNPVDPLNTPPHQPVVIVPPDSKTNVDIDVTLQWSGGDPDAGDIVTYDIYLGESNPPSELISDLTVNSYQLTNLKFNTTYYWQVISYDNQEQTSESEIWSFRTRPENILAPFMPNTPHPTNNASGLDIHGINLAWICADPNGIDTLSYDLYFGTTSPPTNLIAESITDTSFNLPLLDFDTQYFWQVVAKNSFDMETGGPEWNFTTKSAAYYFYDNFDNYFSGSPPPDSVWAYYGNFGTVVITDQVFYGATGQSCQLIDSTLNYSNGLIKEFTPQKSVAVFEFAWQVGRSDDYLGVRLYPQTVDSLHRGPQISIRGDSLEYYDRDFTWKYITAIDSATWYQMKIVFDCNSQIYSIYVNNEMLVADAGWTGQNIEQFRYAYFLTFSNRRCSAGYVDEVRYYASEQYIP